MRIAPAPGSLGIAHVVERYVRPTRPEVCVASSGNEPVRRSIRQRAGTPVFANSSFEVFRVPSR